MLQPSFMMCPVSANRKCLLSILLFDIEAGVNTFGLNRVIDDMRRLIEKYPGGFEDWVRQSEAAAASINAVEGWHSFA